MTHCETYATLNIFRLLAAVTGVSHHAVNMRLALSFFVNDDLLKQETLWESVEMLVNKTNCMYLFIGIKA